LKKKKYTPTQLLSFDPEAVLCNSLYCDLPQIDGGYNYDCEPDLFLFSFLQYSGSFMIDNQGQVRATNKGFKVDLSGLTEQKVLNKYPLNSEIKITTPDGYIYSFGSLDSSINALEYNFRFKPGQTYPLSKRRPTIMAWHLTKITAPNGRNLKINYASSYPESYSSPLWQSSQSIIPNSTPQDYSYMANNIVMPESIEIEDTGVKIEFMKSIETCRNFYNNYTEYNSPSYQLDGIQIKQNEELLYTYHFAYENVQHLRFLSQISQADKGLYTFSYNHTVYPEPSTTYVDFWGYWKLTQSSSGGGSGPVPRPPELLVARELDSSPIATSVTSLTPTAYSLLQKVTYPTGGFTEFSYEPHQYGSRVETHLSSTLWSFTPQLIPVDGQPGGFRIKAIKNTDIGNSSTNEEAHTDVKMYSYLKNGLGQKSSGILYQYPPYEIINSNDTAYVWNDVWHKNYNIEEPHIGYSEVKESYNDGSYTNYTYSDYTNCPDTPDVSFKSNGFSVDLSLLVATNVNRVSSSAYKRGILLEKSTFNNSGKKLKMQTYSYTNILETSQVPKVDTIADSKYNDCIVSFKPISGGAMAKQIYIQNNLPVKETQWDFIGENNISYQKEFGYNEFDLLANETETSSKKYSLKNTYTYPTDLCKSLHPNIVYTQMAENNFLSKLVETKHYKDSLFLSAIMTKYSVSASGSVLIDTVLTQKRGSVYEPRDIYSIYDDYGNPVYKIKNNNERIVYLWGYRHQYMIAEVHNASYDEVKTALTGTTPEQLSLSLSPNMSLLNAIRQKLPNALVTTYTYKPLVGMTSMCSPDGKITTYEYDSMGRLVSVKDNNGKIVENYTYHYQPY